MSSKNGLSAVRHEAKTQKLAREAVPADTGRRICPKGPSILQTEGDDGEVRVALCYIVSKSNTKPTTTDAHRKSCSYRNLYRSAIHRFHVVRSFSRQAPSE